jgi:hypothetical protein
MNYHLVTDAENPAVYRGKGAATYTSKKGILRNVSFAVEGSLTSDEGGGVVGLVKVPLGGK